MLRRGSGAVYGQKIRGFFTKTIHPAVEPPAPDPGGNGKGAWKDTTDQPPPDLRRAARRRRPVMMGPGATIRASDEITAKRTNTDFP